MGQSHCKNKQQPVVARSEPAAPIETPAEISSGTEEQQRRRTEEQQRRRGTTVTYQPIKHSNYALLYEQRDLTGDLIIECATGVQMSAHRCVLAAASPVLQAMLYGPMQESQEPVIRPVSYTHLTLPTILRV